MHQILGRAEKNIHLNYFPQSLLLSLDPVEKGCTRIYTLPKNDSKLRMHGIQEK